jgi:hypothetical protein
VECEHVGGAQFMEGSHIGFLKVADMYVHRSR